MPKKSTKVEGIETVISCLDQPLPVNIDRFWPVLSNKRRLQQFFTQWILQKCQDENFDKTLFLGGSHKESDTICYSLIDGLVNKEKLLKCMHEEADDRIFFMQTML